MYGLDCLLPSWSWVGDVGVRVNNFTKSHFKKRYGIFGSGNPKSRMDYISKTSTDPGVGVAGTLWSESTLTTLAAVQSGVQTLSDKFRRMAPLPTSPKKQVTGNADGI
jgi:hypothetical protein